MKEILTPKEILMIQSALQIQIEDVESVSKNPALPFDPQAREDMRNILTTAKSALEKIGKMSGGIVGLAPYNEGDENEFFTKES